MKCSLCKKTTDLLFFSHQMASSKKPSKGKATEFNVSSSGSDFDDDDDPDCVEVPGGGRDLNTISKIVEPGLRMASSQAVGYDDLLLPTPASQQPGYDVIRVAPGASPFGPGAGIKQQTASVMQQALNMVKNSPPGHVRMNVPLSAVQSMLKSGALQVITA